MHKLCCTFSPKASRCPGVSSTGATVDKQEREHTVHPDGPQGGKTNKSLSPHSEIHAPLGKEGLKEERENYLAVL